jgi:hypothetical protein
MGVCYRPECLSLVSFFQPSLMAVSKAGPTGPSLQTLDLVGDTCQELLH